MPRNNNNQPNRRLGQVDNMVRNTQEDRQQRLNRLLRRDTEEEVIEPRNRQERREQGIRNNDNTEENNFTSRGQRANTFYVTDTMRLMQQYLADWSGGASSSGTSRYTVQQPKYIKSFNYVPSEFNFHNTELDKNEKYENLYMGVELEIDYGGESDDNAKFIQDYLGENNCYIMHDGSLVNGGLEITTHPCSLNYHKSLPYEGLFKELISKGYKSHDTKTCGLHVHVNRNFFGEDPTMQDLCITKVLYLLEKYWDNVKSIARRDSSTYAQRFYMKENESLFNLLTKAKSGDGYNNAKYQIVNLLHKNTIEFRLFKGTLKYETFISTLEFVRNLVYLCKNKPLEQIQMTTFEEIMYSLDSEYLIKYAKERGINIADKIAI